MKIHPIVVGLFHAEGDKGGRADMTKIVVFRNFEKTLKNHREM
jgi:hypothetical protein